MAKKKQIKPKKKNALETDFDMSRITNIKIEKPFQRKTIQRIKYVLRNLLYGNELYKSCSICGVSVPSVLAWSKKSEENEKLLNDIYAYRLAPIEDQLFKLCMKGNLRAIKFFLTNADPKKWNVEKFQTVTHKGAIEIKKRILDD